MKSSKKNPGKLRLALHHSTPWHLWIKKLYTKNVIQTSDSAILLSRYQWGTDFHLLLSVVMMNLCCPRHTSYCLLSSQRNKLAQQNKLACEGIPWVTLVPGGLSSPKQASNWTLAAVLELFTVKGIWVSSIPSWYYTSLALFLFSRPFSLPLLCPWPFWASWCTCSPSTAPTFINSKTDTKLL